jgi:hypothetical protein
MPKLKPAPVCIGLRAKTGRAIAVALVGPPDSPRVVKRCELKVWDPRVPATFQPYHEVLELPWERAQVAVRRIATKIEAVASRALSQLVKEVEADGFVVRAVGVVGAGDRNLEKIGSTHIRAHAAEGVLFRQVLEFAASANKLRSRRFDERSLDEMATLELRRSSLEIKDTLAAMGRDAGSPWRADEKAAATAAWVSLATARKT